MFISADDGTSLPFSILELAAIKVSRTLAK